MLMFTKFLCLLLLIHTSNIFADDSKVEDLINSIDKKELEKLSPQEKQQFAMLQLMMLEMEGQVMEKAFKKTIEPKIVAPEKAGLKFKILAPIYAQKPIYHPLDEYKVNPNIKPIDYEAISPKSNCINCFNGSKESKEFIDFIFYPTNSDFHFAEFIRFPNEIGAVIVDKNGKRVFVSKFHLPKILGERTDGNELNQILSVGKEIISLTVTPNRLDHFQKELKEKDYWDFPYFPNKTSPSFKPDEYENWFNFAAQGFLGSRASKIFVTNIRKLEYQTIMDVQLNYDTYAFLHHAGILKHYSDRTNTVANVGPNPPILDVDSTTFMKQLKEKHPIVQPSKEELDKAKKEVIAEMKIERAERLKNKSK